MGAGDENVRTCAGEGILRVGEESVSIMEIPFVCNQCVRVNTFKSNVFL